MDPFTKGRSSGTKAAHINVETRSTSSTSSTVAEYALFASFTAIVVWSDASDILLRLADDSPEAEPIWCAGSGWFSMEGVES